MTELDLQSLMRQMESRFRQDRAAGVNARVQFHVTGAQGGDWVATIKDQKLAVEAGTVTSPSLTISADAAEISKMLGGKSNPMQAFMQGKIQIKGDATLAMRLLDLFKRS